MMNSKREMLILIEDLIDKKGFPIDIKINTKHYIKSKIDKNKTLRYENEIILVFNDEEIKVNEVFYYTHVATIICHINDLIEQLKKEQNI